MILFHGSNEEIVHIDLDKCRPFKDFGRGFYLTDMQEQATQMARRVCRRFGGSPIVNMYEIDDSALSGNGLKVKEFLKPDGEWARFVLQNRDRKVIQPAHHFDVVIGPVANDDIATLFRTFSLGFIDLDTLVKGLEYKELTRQFLFHTTKAVSLLQNRGIL